MREAFEVHLTLTSYCSLGYFVFLVQSISSIYISFWRQLYRQMNSKLSAVVIWNLSKLYVQKLSWCKKKYNQKSQIFKPYFYNAIPITSVFRQILLILQFAFAFAFCLYFTTPLIFILKRSVYIIKVWRLLYYFSVFWILFVIYGYKEGIKKILPRSFFKAQMKNLISHLKF